MAEQEIKKKRHFVFWQQIFSTWLNKRIPAAAQQQLTHRNLFIFPTRFGFAYLIFVLVLFLLGTNYQNNLIMLLSYFLASLFISVMLHSFLNLSGLTLIGKKKVKGFAEDRIFLSVKVLSDQTRFAINFNIEGQESISVVEILPSAIATNNQVLLPYDTVKRGVYSAERVTIASEYPLGLFTCWTKLDFACQLIIYPKPLALKLTAQAYGKQAQEQQGHALEQHGDDFYQLKAYQQGEPLTQVAWKQLAKGQGMLTKSYQSTQGSETWLKLADMPSSDIEKKLAYLCYLIQQYYHNDQRFGLDLYGDIIKPDHSKEHFEQCLYALAVFAKAS